MPELKTRLKHRRKTIIIKLENHRFNIIWLLRYILIGLIFIAFAGVQTGKYLLERARIDALRAALDTRASHPVAAISPTSSTAISAPVSAPLAADKQVSEGVYILREMLEVVPEILAKDKIGSSGASIEWGKFANIAIDTLAGAGKITAQEAISLHQELLKPTIDVGVYAAKAAVDRFISGKTPAKSETTDKTGAASAVGNHVEITMYGVKEYVAAAPPKPKPPMKPTPCDKAPITNKKPPSTEGACKSSQCCGQVISDTTISSRAAISRS